MDPFAVAAVALLVLGAAARLTRLVTVDSIADPLRDGVRMAANRVGPRTLVWADDLVTCPHCVGFWATLAVLATAAAWGHTAAWRFVAATLAASYVVGHLSRHLDGP